MDRHLEICLEELDRAGADDDLVRCVALPGGEPGLALDREGAVRWMPETPEVCGLWTSLDGQLVLLRAPGAAAARVERGGRAVEAPVGKPVILRDQDLIALGGRRLRVHLHGEAPAVHAPERLSRSAFARLVAAAAAAVTLGGAPAPGTAGPSGSQPPPIEVRQNPPGAPAPRAGICQVTRQTVPRGGKLTLTATCRGGQRLGKGSMGELLDARTNRPVADGQVTITAVKGDVVTAEASKLTKPVAGAILRFWGGF
jgi:hypothetical protein